MPQDKPTTPEELAYEIAKRKLAIGAQYKTINELQERLRDQVGCGVTIEIPQLGKTLAIRDNFADKVQHWKNVCCDRFESILESL